MILLSWKCCSKIGNCCCYCLYIKKRVRWWFHCLLCCMCVAFHSIYYCYMTRDGNEKKIVGNIFFVVSTCHIINNYELNGYNLRYCLIKWHILYSWVILEFIMVYISLWGLFEEDIDVLRQENINKLKDEFIFIQVWAQLENVSFNQWSVFRESQDSHWNELIFKGDGDDLYFVVIGDILDYQVYFISILVVSRNCKALKFVVVKQWCFQFKIMKWS